MKNATSRIVFMGTSDFAVEILKKLSKSHEVIEVFTQPDRKVGRKQISSPTAVKKLALSLDLPIFQPEELDHPLTVNHLKELKPEFIIVAAYGKILPQSILNIPSRDCLNIHASILPKYRGASPIQTAILEGEVETGVTIMQMDAGLDTGKIVKQSKISIEDDDDYISLEKKLSLLGSDLLLEVLKLEKFDTTVQDETLATFSRILTKGDGLLDFKNNSAREIERQIRALTVWPQTFTFWNGKRLKVLSADFENSKPPERESGRVYFEDDKVKIACKEGFLLPLKLQIEGKRPLDEKEFLRGYPNLLGSLLEISS